MDLYKRLLDAAAQKAEEAVKASLALTLCSSCDITF